MSPVAKELLRVQKKQFEMGIMWIGIIQNPDVTPEDKKTAIEQYATLWQSMMELQFETLNLDLTKTILEC